MEDTQPDVITKRGWQPIPLALKILSGVLILWSIGAVLNASNLYASGLPLLGTFIYGIPAILVILFLDIIGPLVFVGALILRKTWAPRWAYFYISLFIANSIVALATVRDELGVPQILIPMVVSMTFVSVIYWKRAYFT